MELESEHLLEDEHKHIESEPLIQRSESPMLKISAIFCGMVTIVYHFASSMYLFEFTSKKSFQTPMRILIYVFMIAINFCFFFILFILKKTHSFEFNRVIYVIIAFMIGFIIFFGVVFFGVSIKAGKYKTIRIYSYSAASIEFVLFLWMLYKDKSRGSFSKFFKSSKSSKSSKKKSSGAEITDKQRQNEMSLSIFFFNICTYEEKQRDKKARLNITDIHSEIINQVKYWSQPFDDYEPLSFIALKILFKYNIIKNPCMGSKLKYNDLVELFTPQIKKLLKTSVDKLVNEVQKNSGKIPKYLIKNHIISTYVKAMCEAVDVDEEELRKNLQTENWKQTSPKLIKYKHNFPKAQAQNADNNEIKIINKLRWRETYINYLNFSVYLLIIMFFEYFVVNKLLSFVYFFSLAIFYSFCLNLFKSGNSLYNIVKNNNKKYINLPLFTPYRIVTILYHFFSVTILANSFENKKTKNLPTFLKLFAIISFTALFAKN